MGRLIKWSLWIFFALVLIGALSRRVQQSFPTTTAQASYATPQRDPSASSTEQNATEARPSTATGKWTIDGGRSSFDDSPTVQLLLVADKAISGWPNKVETPILILRCQEHKTEAFIQTGVQPNVEYGRFAEATVRIRLDGDPATTRVASKSTDGDALFLPQPVALIRGLVKHKRMLFGFTPFNSPPVETEFDLDGLSEAVKPLREACAAN